MATIQSTRCLLHLRVLFALVLVTLGHGTPGVLSMAIAQTSTVVGLAGTALTASSPNASGDCLLEEGTSTFSFTTSGTSTGAYPGTFTESGTVSTYATSNYSTQRMTSFSSTFTIDSPNGQVSGTKWLEPESFNSQNIDSGACQPLRLGGYRYYGGAWNLRYEATIVTPDGRMCSDTGFSTLFFSQGYSAQPDTFSETYYVDVASPYPSCTGGGGEQPPGQPTTKEDCKDGVWEESGFDNQGQCIKFVNEAD